MVVHKTINSRVERPGLGVASAEEVASSGAVAPVAQENRQVTAISHLVSIDVGIRGFPVSKKQGDVGAINESIQIQVTRASGAVVAIRKDLASRRRDQAVGIGHLKFEFIPVGLGSTAQGFSLRRTGTGIQTPKPPHRHRRFQFHRRS